MQLTLLSGVVRNRKMAGAVSRASSLFVDGTEAPRKEPETITEKVWDILSRSAVCRKFKLRVHKFTFQWDLILHMSICIGSLAPFFFTGDRQYTWIPLVVWSFYNSLVIIGPRYANSVVPGFNKLQHSFKATIEDFFSPKLLPVLSISFLLVALSLIVTGRRLGGPPLCYQSCGQCLSRWSRGVIVDPAHSVSEDEMYRVGCGFVNGKELLGLYTMAQTSFLLFLTVVVAMAVCLAWRVAPEERVECSDAEDWLKRQDPKAFELRNEIVKLYGSPASSIRPEGSATWVFYGVTAALSFTLLGWHNWYVLPPSHTATLLIVLNLLTILMTLLILHLGFFGRLLALYKRNYLRVEYLTTLLGRVTESDIDYWWNCRNFVLNDDLSLDYDIGGLAVSVTFLINLLLFVTLTSQMYREGFKQALFESPGSYCAYACMYLTSCLIKLFTLATKTYEEQFKHVSELQLLSIASYHKSAIGGGGGGGTGGGNNNRGDQTPLSGPSQSLLHAHVTNWQVNEQDYLNLRDDGPLDIDESSCSEHETDHLLSAVIKGEKTELLPPLPPKVKRQNSANISSPRTQQAVAKKNHFHFLETVASNTQAFWNRDNNTNNNNNNTNNNNTPKQSTDNLHTYSSPPTNNNNNTTNSHGLSLPAGGTSMHRLALDAGAVEKGDIENSLSLRSFSVDSGGSGGGNSSPKMSGSRSPKSPKMTSKSQHSVQQIALAQNHHHAQHTTTSSATHNLPRPLNIAIPPPINTTMMPTLQQSTNGVNGSTAETYRQTIAEFMSQINKYDPIPCILGIPIMPGIFSIAKLWIFVFFFGMGFTVMVSFLSDMRGWQ